MNDRSASRLPGRSRFVAGKAGQKTEAASAGPPLEMKVGRIEFRQGLEPLPIVNLHLALAKGEQFLFA